MTLLADEGDGVAWKRIVYIARKVEGLHLVLKSGNHRGCSVSSTTPKRTTTWR